MNLYKETQVIKERYTVNAMFKLVFIFLVFLFVSCQSTVKENESKFVVSKEEAIDTLCDPSAFYYLYDIHPKQYGELILKDSIYPSDNMSTFRVMDSINAKSLADRQFYLKVFQRIMAKSDGALAESVGSPAWDYTEEHTLEFITYASKLKNEELKYWIGFIGFEIGSIMSVDKRNANDLEEYRKRLNDNCSQCSIVNKEFLKIFLDSLEIQVKENLENDM